MKIVLLASIASLLTAAPLVRIQQHTLHAKIQHDANLTIAIASDDDSFLEFVPTGENQYQLIRLRAWWDFIPIEETEVVKEAGTAAAPSALPPGLPIGCATFETSCDGRYVRAICEKIQIGALRHRVSERRHEVFTIPTIHSAGFVDDPANHPTKALLAQHGLQHFLLTIKDGKSLSVYLIPAK